MKIDRTQIRVFDSFGERDAADREYWKSLTPEERLTALEMMRQIAYGYDEGQRGLQGFFEVAEQKKEVEYLLIGGYAVGYHGYPRPTGDMDIWIRPSPENAVLAAEAVTIIGYEDLPT